jgi:hypothetical protein
MSTPSLAKEVAEDTIRHWYSADCNIAAAARRMKLSRNTVSSRLERSKQLFPELFIEANNSPSHEWTLPQFHEIDLDSGTVLIGSDAHIWPDNETIMMKAFARLSKELKPRVIVLNGDILDGARVSRHGSLLGQNAPKLTSEINAAHKWINTLYKPAERVWTMGNHDQRVDNYLANNAPELDDYAGRLSDRFPDWTFCWATTINNLEVRHRFRSGIHAGWNSALHSGISTVTGHTHQLQVTAVRNRNGTHWGIECGMLGDPAHKAFEYTEGQANRTQAGFVVITFRNGIMMPPETCELIDGRPVFRGDYII